MKSIGAMMIAGEDWRAVVDRDLFERKVRHWVARAKAWNRSRFCDACAHHFYNETQRPDIAFLSGYVMMLAAFSGDAKPTFCDAHTALVARMMKVLVPAE